MNIFYNKQGIGDVLIIPIKEGKRYSVAFERYGDVAKIYHAQTKELFGYNIFQASKYFTFGSDSKITLTAEWLEQINNVLQKNGVEETLEVDLSPKFVVGYVKEKVINSQEKLREFSNINIS